MRRLLQNGLYYKAGQVLQSETIITMWALTERNEEIYKLCEENNLLKTSKFSYEYLQNQMIK